MYKISSFPKDSIVTPTLFEPQKYGFDHLYHKSDNFRIN